MIFASDNELSCPSKTFLCGEYSVLVGGHGLVVTHRPRFVLKANPISGANATATGDTPPLNFPVWLHPQSPAGIWYSRHQEILKNFSFEFLDPHEGRGGFGASGAQFVLLHAFTDSILKKHTNKYTDMFSDFRACDLSNSSGSDILAQSLDGELVDVDPEQGMSYTLTDWPFKNLDYLVCPTGKKIPTHSHLANLEKKKLKPLVEISGSVLRSVVDGDQDQFLRSMDEFSRNLQTLDLVAAHTQELLSALKTCPGYKMAKGCGALGSDALVVIVEAEQANRAKEYVSHLGLSVIATRF